jgi:hypothetical protein
MQFSIVGGEQIDPVAFASLYGLRYTPKLLVQVRFSGFGQGHNSGPERASTALATALCCDCKPTPIRPSATAAARHVDTG